MVDYVKSVLTGQFEAALAMLRFGIIACPEDHWERKIAYGSIRWAVYHTLFIADLYLSKSFDDFVMRDIHHEGGDERGDVACVGLPREKALAYVPVVLQKARAAIAVETEESLRGPSGIPWYDKYTRLELHMVSIRHIHHHAAQLHAYLRREGLIAENDRKTLPWIGKGWRE